jgi:hypothetical protein
MPSKVKIVTGATHESLRITTGLTLKFGLAVFMPF